MMPKIVRFPPFSFRHGTAELLRDDEVVHLRPQAAALLELLLEEPGRLVTRERIREGIWGDTVVEYEQGIHALVRELREALGDDASDPRYLATVPRRGYRFVAEVEEGGVRAARPPSFAMLVAAILVVALAVALPRYLAPSRPLGVTVLPPVMGTVAGEPALPGMSQEDLQAVLDEAVAGASGVRAVPWRLGDPAGADLALEATAGREPGDPAGDVVVTLRLYRWPGRAMVWSGEARAADSGELPLRLRETVRKAVASTGGPP